MIDDERIQEQADEAEAGYDVGQMKRISRSEAIRRALAEFAA